MQNKMKKLTDKEVYKPLLITCKICGCESEFDYCSESCYLEVKNECELNFLENQSNEQ
jgi:hypothetical protein